MSTEDTPAPWLLARSALDNREAVTALTDAMPGYLDSDTETPAYIAEALARAGFALVRIEPGDQGFLAREGD
jgi:hypothetical protein